MKKAWDLRERTMDFAAGVFRFCRTLPHTDEARDVARQLRRCGTSVAANYRASQRGKSHRDFVAKLGTVIEEADESLFWLEFLERVELAPQAAVQSHRSEADELVRIFTAAQKTARSRGARTDTRRRPKRIASFSIPD
jgi:four helix bundle protein